MRFLDPPLHSKNSQTTTAATTQHVANFPPDHFQHLEWLGQLLSCKSVDATNDKGWNILHHLFQMVSPSILAANIVRNMASREYPSLPGDMRIAMAQKTTGPDPPGWTPLHFLCQDCDHHFKKRDLLCALLDSEVVMIREFDIPDGQVFFLL